MIPPTKQTPWNASLKLARPPTCPLCGAAIPPHAWLAVDSIVVCADHALIADAEREAMNAAIRDPLICRQIKVTRGLFFWNPPHHCFVGLPIDTVVARLYNVARFDPLPAAFTRQQPAAPPRVLKAWTNENDRYDERLAELPPGHA